MAAIAARLSREYTGQTQIASINPAAGLDEYFQPCETTPSRLDYLGLWRAWPKRRLHGATGQPDEFRWMD